MPSAPPMQEKFTFCAAHANLDKRGLDIKVGFEYAMGLRQAQRRKWRESQEAHPNRCPECGAYCGGPVELIPQPPDARPRPFDIGTPY